VGQRNVTITNPDLGEATKLNAFEITHTPDVDYLDPASRSYDLVFQTITVFAKGPYFQDGCDVWFSTHSSGLPKDSDVEITGNKDFINAAKLILYSIEISSSAPSGGRYITVENPDGGIFTSASTELEIVAAPTLDSALVVTGSNPTNQLGKNSSKKTLVVTGSGFESGIAKSNITFDVRNDSITVESVTWNSETELEVKVTVTTNCLTGGCSVQIRNPETQGLVTNATTNYFVIGEMPVISTITSPAVKEYGKKAYTLDYADKKFKLNGAAFNSMMEVWFGATQMTPIDPETLFDGTTWYQCDFNVSDTFLPLAEPLDVKVINPDQGEYSLANAFTINDAPDFATVSLTPASRGKGAQNQEIIVKCDNFVVGSTLTLVGMEGTPTTFHSYNYDYGTSSFSVKLNVDIEAVAGDYDVRIMNPDLGYDVDIEGFKVALNPVVTTIDPDNIARGATGSTITISGPNNSYQTGCEVIFSTVPPGVPQDPSIVIPDPTVNVVYTNRDAGNQITVWVNVLSTANFGLYQSFSRSSGQQAAAFRRL